MTQRDVSYTIASAQTYSIFGWDATLGDWPYIRYYCLGSLYLPQGGYSAWVKILGLGNGYSVSIPNSDNQPAVPSNYSIDVYLYSSNNFAGMRLLGPNNQVPTLLAYHNGFCVSQAIGPTASAVYIVPDETRPEEVIQIWIRGCINQGVPFSMGIAGGGGYYSPGISFVRDTLPERGWKDLITRRIVYSS